ncbi:MAG: hypothetical protein AABZ08_11350 [Planctomycetota bacterium]
MGTVRFGRTIVLNQILLLSTLAFLLGGNLPAWGQPSKSAVELESVDPATRMTFVSPIDPSRIKQIDYPKYEDPSVDEAIRSALPCQNIAYRNLPPSQISVFLFGGGPGADNVADDCRLPPNSPNRFICAAQVRTLGYTQGGPATYNLLVQVWTDCPEDPGATLLSQGNFFAIPNDGIQRVQTLTVDPPNLEDDDQFWVLVQSDNPDAAWEIARDTTEINDVGNTAATFAILNGQGDCSDNFFIFAGLHGGFTCTLLGSAGPAGSCCNLTNGICTDGVLQSGCNDFLTQSWSTLSCANAPPCAACTTACAFPGPNPPNREQEPDCFTNYIDTTNRGCQNLTTRAIGTFWTPLNCTTAASGCGRTGTYTFLNVFFLGGSFPPVVENRRDDDHYMLALTQDTRVTWTVKGKFPSQAIVSFTLRQTNGISTGVNCPTFMATDPGDVSMTQVAACNESVATACLPGRNGPEGPFRYFLRARPSVTKLGTNALCGLPYEYALTCEPCTRAPSAADLGACCTTTGCVDTSRLACLILTGSDALYFQGEGTTCPNSACTGAPANDTCPNKKTLTCTTCVVTFDTTFAGSEGQSFGAGTQVFKDVWYKYTSQQPGGCTSGRLVVSTLGTCFNSKVQMLRIINCFAAQATQCTGLFLHGAIVPIPLEEGPPIVNIGPFIYGQNTGVAVTPNQCHKIRVGGLTEDDFGLGTIRIDFICTTAQAGFSWSSETGRCCFPDGTCLITPLATAANGPTCCGTLGGYIRNRTDFYEGRTPPQTGGEVVAVGCSTLPCPTEGEACFNAWDLNTLFGGGFGTITRSATNRIYYKYVVPPATPVGSGIVINTCGSLLDPLASGLTPLDTALALYRGFNLTSGECDGTSSTQACIGTAFNSSEIVRALDCGPTDGLSVGATGHVPCFGLGEPTTCVCVRVIDAGGTPLAGEVRQGETVYIGIGAEKQTINGDSLRPFFDPIRAEGCNAPVEYRLQVAGVATCSSCTVICPGGTIPEPETMPGQPCLNYADHVNAGCSSPVIADQLFTPIFCGETYCGTSATYRKNTPCVATADCPFGDNCIGSTCQGPYDNSRDNDWYRIQITQPMRLTWEVNATFPAAIRIIQSPTNDCADQTIAADTFNPGPCSTIVTSADLCPGWAYLVVAPAYAAGVPCGSLYYATLTCSPPSTLTSTCCKGDMNNDGGVDGRDIRPWINQLLPIANGGQPAIELNPSLGCYDAFTCQADLDDDYAVTLADLSNFVALLLADSPCNATACDDSAACHLPSESDIGVVSDLSTATYGGGYRCADNFKVVTGTSLSSLCWYGYYFNFNGSLGCAPQGGDSTDNFSVTIYDDASGLPGAVLSGPTALNTITKTDTGVDLLYLQNTVRRFKYEAALPAAVSVTPGGCYWIEIVNQSTGTCLWLWETASLGGDGMSAQKPGGIAGVMNWYSFDLTTNDFAFCLSGLRIDNLDCGLPLGKCCVYPPMSQYGDCSLQTRPTCEVNLGGFWTLGADCNSPCPIKPLNDFCANAQLITTGPIYSGSTLYATTDGPTKSCEFDCGANCNSAKDVWYKWVATFNGLATFTMCDAWGPPGITLNDVPIDNDNYRYDSIMVVYYNCPSAGGSQIPGGCNDDGYCVPIESISSVTVSTIVANQTYWIRISGWQGAEGNFVLRVNQP